MIGDGSFYRKL